MKKTVFTKTAFGILFLGSLAMGVSSCKKDSSKEATTSTTTSSANESYYTFDADSKSITGLSAAGAGQTELKIPATYGGVTVTTIGTEAFKDKTAITSVNIPANVNTIGDQAFAGCTSLKSITFESSSNSAASLGVMSTSYGVLATASLTLEAGSLGSGVFEGDATLQTITNMDKAPFKKIKGKAFKGCGKLDSLALPTALEEVEDNVFNDCANLKEVSFPEKVAKIGKELFAGCGKLSGVEFKRPEPPTLGGELFEKMTNTPSVFIPEANMSKYENASDAKWAKAKEVVSNNTAKAAILKAGLAFTVEKSTTGTHVVITGLTEFGKKLKKIVIPRQIPGQLPTGEIKEDAFKDNKTLETLYFEPSKTPMTLGKNAFAGCTALTEVMFAPANILTSVGDSAFDKCTALTDVGLPVTTEIKAKAFAGCAKLKTFTLASSITIGNDVLPTSTEESYVIYVPDTSKYTTWFTTLLTNFSMSDPKPTLSSIADKLKK